MLISSHFHTPLLLLYHSSIASRPFHISSYTSAQSFTVPLGASQSFMWHFNTSFGSTSSSTTTCLASLCNCFLPHTSPRTTVVTPQTPQKLDLKVAGTIFAIPTTVTSHLNLPIPSTPLSSLSKSFDSSFSTLHLLTTSVDLHSPTTRRHRHGSAQELPSWVCPQPSGPGHWRGALSVRSYKLRARY